MSVRRKSPQEKKALSLKKDRRDSYGEHAKGSRKTVPRRKALENRKTRHRNNQAIAGIEKADAGAADLIESSARHDVLRVGGWKKAPHAPLGEYIKWGLEGREQRAGRKARHRQRHPELSRAAPETAS